MIYYEAEDSIPNRLKQQRLIRENRKELASIGHEGQVPSLSADQLRNLLTHRLGLDSVTYPSETPVAELTTPQFLAYCVDQVVKVVSSPDYFDEYGYIAAESWVELLGVMQPALGQRQSATETRRYETMQVGRILSFVDSHLGLSYGIEFALFTQVVEQFVGDDRVELREELLDRARGGQLLGLAITDLYASGTEAVNTEAQYSDLGDTVHLRATKHFQGNSGREGLIVWAKKENSRSFALFFVPQSEIETQLTETQGFQGIQYGINRFDVVLDKERHLIAEIPGNKLREFRDIFIASRLQFPPFTLGMLERTEAEAMMFAHNRQMNGRKLIELPAAQTQLAEITARRVIVQAIHQAIIEEMGDDQPVEPQFLVANATKVLSSTYAWQASQDRAELMGARSFYKGSALQDANDAYAPQIFEGPTIPMNVELAKGILKFKGFSNFEKGEAEDLLDYLRKLDAHLHSQEGPQPFFRFNEAVRLLEGETVASLIAILPPHEEAGRVVYDDTHYQILGGILSRMFALGQLSHAVHSEDEDARAPGLSTTEVTLAMRLLNTEIRTLCVELAAALGATARGEDQDAGRYMQAFLELFTMPPAEE